MILNCIGVYLINKTCRAAKELKRFSKLCCHWKKQLVVWVPMRIGSPLWNDPNTFRLKIVNSATAVIIRKFFFPGKELQATTELFQQHVGYYWWKVLLLWFPFIVFQSISFKQHFLRNNFNNFTIKLEIKKNNFIITNIFFKPKLKKGNIFKIKS